PRPNLRDLHVLAGSEKAADLIEKESDVQDSSDSGTRRDPLSLALDLLINARREELQNGQSKERNTRIAEDLYSAAGLFREIGASAAGEVTERLAALTGPTPPVEQTQSRSEERRVGKAGRYWGTREQGT